ncbi:hypothetical protein, partial [Parachitinimonas caeni]
ALTPGQTLKIPSTVTAANRSDTFKPYNAQKLIGETTPELPPPPPPPQPGRGGCGGIAQIVMIVVAVVVTVYTAGAAASALGAATTSATAVGGTAVAAGTTAAATAASVGTLATGAAALGGTFGAAGLAAAAIGGAVGSLASQMVGVAFGVQDSISWKGVATSALSAGITAGIGGSGLGEAIKGLGYGKAATSALTAAASSTISQGILSAAGLGSFSWRNVAAAAIAAPVADAIGDNIFGTTDATTGRVAQNGASWARGNDLLANVANNFLGGVVNRTAQILVNGGGKLDIANIAANAFGDAIGNSITGRNRAVLYESEAVRQLSNEQYATYQQMMIDVKTLQRNGNGSDWQIPDELLQNTLASFVAESPTRDEDSPAFESTSAATDRSARKATSKSPEATDNLPTGPVTTGFGSPVDELAAKSPTFQNLWAKARQNKIDISVSSDPNFSTSARGNKITLNQDVLTDPEETIRVLAHEITHVLYKNPNEKLTTLGALIGNSSHDEFIPRFIQGQLLDEGEAALVEIQVQRECNISKDKQHQSFVAIYEQFENGSLSRDEARKKMGDEFRQVNPNHQSITYETKITREAEDSWNSFTSWVKNSELPNLRKNIEILNGNIKSREDWLSHYKKVENHQFITKNNEDRKTIADYEQQIRRRQAQIAPTKK